MATPSGNPKDIANEIALADDTDIALYNGPIGRLYDEDVITGSVKRKRRRLLMMLVTEGGNPDCAYRIALSSIEVSFISDHWWRARPRKMQNV